MLRADKHVSMMSSQTFRDDPRSPCCHWSGQRRHLSLHHPPPIPHLYRLFVYLSPAWQFPRTLTLQRCTNDADYDMMSGAQSNSKPW